MTLLEPSTDDLRLQGVFNFRDFGGYPTEDGRRVRRGRLFRSGHYADATDDDLAQLGALDIAVITDLRRAAERERYQRRLPSPCRAKILEHGAPPAEATALHLAFMNEPDATPEHIAELMKQGYRGYPYDPPYMVLFREYFEHLAEAEGPVLIHCHAGKDRTGLLAALTHYVLGVPWEHIHRDYLRTNEISVVEKRLQQLMEDFEREHGRPPEEAKMKRMLMVDLDYLNSSLDEIQRQHGDLDTYLEQVLGVTPQRRERLRQRLLEPA